MIKAEEAGDKLNEDELLAMVFLLLIAGHETTVNLIGNGTLALLENPNEMTKLRSESSLVKPAVEELLLYTSPVLMTTERYALPDAIVHGVTIPRGELTLGVIGSANRDETVFENPDELQITREPKQTPFIRTRYSLLFGRTIGADGSADCFHRSAEAFARLTVEKSFSLFALATKHIFKRTSFVTREVLKVPAKI